MHLNEVRQSRDGRIVHRTLSFSFGNLDAIQQFRRKPLIHELHFPGSGFNEFLLDEGGDLLQFLVYLLETLNLPHQNRLQNRSEAGFLLFLARFWRPRGCVSRSSRCLLLSESDWLSYQLYYALAVSVSGIT